MLPLRDSTIHIRVGHNQLPAEYPGWMLSLQGQYRSKPPVKD
jgi:hypothetical protein